MGLLFMRVDQAPRVKRDRLKFADPFGNIVNRWHFANGASMSASGEAYVW